jgi:hypothetical protein
MNAQIFLSCGQNTENGELNCAEEIRAKIKSMKGYNFSCYLALHEQTLDGVREYIFNHLKKTDYFIFVDFKRLSLWSHQELAIASFLELGVDALLFQENGAKKAKGILGAISGRPTPFSDRKSLPDLICEEIRKKWTDRTTNRLTLECWPENKDVPKGDHILQARHILVRNLHNRKAARNCLGYLDQVVDCRTGEVVSKDWATAEFKWAGTQLAGVRIAEEAHRLLDAAWFAFKNDRCFYEMWFAVAATTDRYPYWLRPGRYQLTFRVVSDNFADAVRDFSLEFGDSIQSIQFEAMPERM